MRKESDGQEFDLLAEAIASMLRRPRALKPQALRHIDEHLAGRDERIEDFLCRAPRELEDFEVEIIFAPLFTPTFEEQLEFADALKRVRPSEEQGEEIAARVLRLVERNVERHGEQHGGQGAVVLPSGETAPLALHEVLVARFVRLLHLQRAPLPQVASAIERCLSAEVAQAALTLLRVKAVGAEHQAWLIGFLDFLSDRRPLDRHTIEVLLDFLAAQASLDEEQVWKGFTALLRAAEDAGSFVQKGRMYWSSDVAEHHQFRGQGTVDSAELSRRMDEFRVVEGLHRDLKAYFRRAEREERSG